MTPSPAFYRSPSLRPTVNRATTNPTTDRASGLLAGMKVRKKLIFLHTFFSLVLAGILAAALWPAITRVVEEAELHEARLALSTLSARLTVMRAVGPLDDTAVARTINTVSAELGPAIVIWRGVLPPPTGKSPPVPIPAGTLGAIVSVSIHGQTGAARLDDGSAAAVMLDDGHPGEVKPALVARATLDDARAAVVRLYIFMTAALLGVYALIALSLEIFVLPRHVYGPIREMLRADRAAQEGDRSQEIIPTSAMPADELGEIMRSRNRTIEALRKHEQDLAIALEQLAFAASDLKKKNHLLEAAQRNLADADRLASLGMMSAGLAHELNTPLSVIKGLVEQLDSSPTRRLDDQESALLVRVVGRLERLSESLLDFARVRPARTALTPLLPLIDEAWTLVRLDREARRVVLENRVSATLFVECDADRLVQVLVNLLRNAADALDMQRRAQPSHAPASSAPITGLSPTSGGRITVEATVIQRDAREWVTITITDNGPGIDPEILGRLFEPFASTRLDSEGTGLGLAVSEGIIREHGGVLLARNREGPPGGGAVFEITLPTRDDRPPAQSPSPPPS